MITALVMCPLLAGAVGSGFLSWLLIDSEPRPRRWRDRLETAWDVVSLPFCVPVYAFWAVRGGRREPWRRSWLR